MVVLGIYFAEHGSIELSSYGQTGLRRTDYKWRVNLDGRERAVLRSLIEICISETICLKFVFGQKFYKTGNSNKSYTFLTPMQPPSPQSQTSVSVPPLHPYPTCVPRSNPYTHTQIKRFDLTILIRINSITPQQKQHTVCKVTRTRLLDFLSIPRDSDNSSP